MLSNEITLAVDTENTGVPTNLVYTRYDEYNNRTVYISEEHEPSTRDELTFYRTFPKPSGTFLGTRKSAFKFSKEFPVLDKEGNTINSPFIFEVSTSIPIGISTADQVEMRQRAIAALDNDTLMNLFHDKQNI